LPKKIKTSCAKDVFINAQTRRHLLAHPDVLPFLEEAISKISIPAGALRFEKAVSLKKIIGVSMLVKTRAVRLNEKTMFAKRINHQWPTRVAPDTGGSACDSVTVAVKFEKERKRYVLLTAYVGYPCPDEPASIPQVNRKKFKESLDFWRKHALVFNEKTMDPYFESTWKKVLNSKIF
jgi:hypothetical protein